MLLIRNMPAFITLIDYNTCSRITLCSQLLSFLMKLVIFCQRKNIFSYSEASAQVQTFYAVNVQILGMHDPQHDSFFSDDLALFFIVCREAFDCFELVCHYKWTKSPTECAKFAISSYYCCLEHNVKSGLYVCICAMCIVACALVCAPIQCIPAETKASRSKFCYDFRCFSFSDYRLSMIVSLTCLFCACASVTIYVCVISFH